MSELETLPRDVSRLAYTQRILEIVGNIRKQKEEITKVRHRGQGGWVIRVDMPKGQMCVAGLHGDLTPSESQSYLAIPRHRRAPHSPLQPPLTLCGWDSINVNALSWPAARPRRAHGYPGLCQILSDTKELQKEINSLSGKLDRTFAVTDELVFKVWGRPGWVRGWGGPWALCEPRRYTDARAWLCPGEDEVREWERVALWGPGGGGGVGAG